MMQRQLSSTSRLVPSQLPSSVHQARQCPRIFSSPTPIYFIVERDFMVCGYMVWSILLANLSKFFWLCPLPSSHPPPAYLLGECPEGKAVWWKKEKALRLCWCCLAKTKILVCYLDCFSQTQNIATYGLLWRNVTLSWPDPEQRGTEFVIIHMWLCKFYCFPGQSRYWRCYLCEPWYFFLRKPLLSLSGALRFYCISNINLNM